MADLQFVGFCFNAKSGKELKEKQFGQPDDFCKGRCYFSLTDEPSRVRFSRGFLESLSSDDDA